MVQWLQTSTILSFASVTHLGGTERPLSFHDPRRGAEPTSAKEPTNPSPLPVPSAHPPTSKAFHSAKTHGGSKAARPLSTQLLDAMPGPGSGPKAYGASAQTS